MEQKNINISVDEGTDFFCNELSINFNPLQFILDFKAVTPRVDLRSKQGPIIHIRHNVVSLDPYHMKQALELLTKVVGDYERDFGKITKPKAVEKMEKVLAEKGVEVKTLTTPSYFG